MSKEDDRAKMKNSIKNTDNTELSFIQKVLERGFR